jgi:hypothetical protein
MNIFVRHRFVDGCKLKYMDIWWLFNGDKNFIRKGGKGPSAESKAFSGWHKYKLFLILMNLT